MPPNDKLLENSQYAPVFQIHRDHWYLYAKKHWKNISPALDLSALAAGYPGISYVNDRAHLIVQAPR